MPDPTTNAILLPQLGETVLEATVTRWHVELGGMVKAGEPLVDLATDKVDTELVAECDGTLIEVLVAIGETVAVGTTLARVAATDLAITTPAAPSEPQTAAITPAAIAPAAITPAAVINTPEIGGVVTSPTTRRRLREANLVPAMIMATGKGGRITRVDVEAAISARSLRATPVQDPVGQVVTTSQAGQAVLEGEPTTSAKVPTPQRHAVLEGEQEPAYQERKISEAISVIAATPADGELKTHPDLVQVTGAQRLQLSRMRRITGARLHESVTTIPHVLSVIEVDLANVERARRAHKEAFAARAGFSLTYLPFIAHALADALRAFPHLNAHYVDAETEPALILHRSLHLGVAVDLDGAGLVVPTVFDADGFRVPLLARRIKEAAEKARAGRLTPAEMTGATFTVSNNGSAGSHLTAAIINPPQVAILSTDAVRRVPVAVTTPDGDEVVVVHPVCNLSLSWDHRAFDGAYAARFLVELKRLLESRDWMAELT